MSEHLPIKHSGSELSDPNSGLSFKARLNLLRERMEKAIYTEGGEEKVVITLPHILDEEVARAHIALRAAVEESIGNGQGVTLNGLFQQQALNIPVRVFDQLGEGGAEKVFNALAPVAQKCMEVNYHVAVLKSLLPEHGKGAGAWSVRRTGKPGKAKDWDERDILGSLEQQARVYAMDFSPRDETENAHLKHVAHALNAAIGEKLFETAYAGDYLRLHIHEERAMPQLMEKLQDPAVRQQVEDIMADPNKAGREYAKGNTWVLGTALRVKDRLSPPSDRSGKSALGHHTKAVENDPRGTNEL